jgi:5-methylthioribose kinase
MGQTLDIEEPEALKRYLRATGRIGNDEQVRIRALPGGVSNRTVLLERPAGEAWVLKQALAKLRVQVDWFSDPSRIRRETAGLRWLAELAPAGSVPALVFEDPAHDLLAMQAVPQPHENFKTLLLAGRVEPGWIEQFGRLLGTIHRRSHERAEEVRPVFEDRSFFESLRLEPYYLYTASMVAPAASFLHQLVETTRAQRLAVVHGDYSPKNVLVHDGRLVLLDHEVIHFGDPAFDVGFAMTHLLSKAHHLHAKRQDFAAAAGNFWGAYLDALGAMPWRDGLEPRAVRHTLACLLARVAGRSPLEYLDEPQRQQQQRAAVAVMRVPPPSFEKLIPAFLERLR